MSETILDDIIACTRSDLVVRKRELPEAAMRQLAECAGPPRDFYRALLAPPGQVRLVAELKRASPSRGVIRRDFDPAALARSYEQGGAAAISVLTEPHFFQGSLEYLRLARAATMVPVLRKDFVVDPYQVYEARAIGADALLLICALLDDRQLQELLHLTWSLGMEALVEVHDAPETRRAIAAGARVIGINNRDLRTFQVSVPSTRALRALIPPDRLVVSESGIFTGADVRQVAEWGVQAVLVGEAIMRHEDVGYKVSELASACMVPRVKMCGIRTLDQALAAAEAGTDFIGLVFASSRRQVTVDAAQEIVAGLHAHAAGGRLCPRVVGVFVGPYPDEANRIGERVELDYVQLSGDEPPDFCRAIRRPVIKALRFRTEHDLAQIDRYLPVAAFLLVDTPLAHAWGGQGRVGDWYLARQAALRAPIILAGGLTSENVAAAIAAVRPWGVDVSSGIETDGVKDPERMGRFMLAVGKQGALREDDHAAVT